MKHKINIKGIKRCAFCKNWYDPGQTAIYPVNAKNGWWEYDDAVINMCMVLNCKRKADSSCGKYVCKIPDINII